VPKAIFCGHCCCPGYVTSARFVRGDYARCNLFSWLDEDKVFERETYKGKAWQQ